MPPRNLGPYEVLSVIGRGGVGTVCRARHRVTGDQVALKLVGPAPVCDPGAARRLAREFEALRGLDHPNVVRVYEAGVYGGYSFLVMELVEGLDLRSYLSPALDEAAWGAAARALPTTGTLTGGCGDGWSWWDEPQTEGLPPLDDEPLTVRTGAAAIRDFAALIDEPETDPPARTCAKLPRGRRPASAHRSASPPPTESDTEAVPAAVLERLNDPGRVRRLRAAMIEVCEGLAYVHAHGLVHRDLKPSNIMVDDHRRVRLMDFGLVQLAADARDRVQRDVVGTYRYMAPEQARGAPLDHRADLYSVGVILFELLFGRLPPLERRADTVPARSGVPSGAAQMVSPLPRGSASIGRVAQRLLAPLPGDRFQTAVEVASALRE